MEWMRQGNSTGASERSRWLRRWLRAGSLSFLLGGLNLLSAAAAPAQALSKIPLATQFDLHEILDGSRTIEVVLPEGYEESDARYPVVYVLDGLQNLRHLAGSAEVLARTGQIPPVIIVGIESTNRMADFTPSSVQDVPCSGGAAPFLEFLGRELTPYIEDHFRTHPYRVLAGHSLGGLFAVYSLMEEPALFDSYIVMSPSLWWNGEEMSQQAEMHFARDPESNAQIYFGIGSEDGLGMQNELGRFVEVLNRRAPAGIGWAHRVFEGEGHMSAPLLVSYHGLKFIFSDMQLPEGLGEEYDDAAFRMHEARIVAKYGGSARQSGETYIGLGLKLMEEEHFQGAITVFERNADAYPIFPPNYAWLASAYEGNGQEAKALGSYREALSRSRAINYGLEEEYLAEIERLEGSSPSAR